MSNRTLPPFSLMTGFVFGYGLGIQNQYRQLSVSSCDGGTKRIADCRFPTAVLRLQIEPCKFFRSKIAHKQSSAIGNRQWSMPGRSAIRRRSLAHILASVRISKAVMALVSIGGFK
jgi:hypothetical protein